MPIRNSIEADPFTDGWDLNYQTFDGTSSAWSDSPQPFLARALSTIQPNSAVIDLGAGDGRNTRPLIEANHRVTALDISERGLLLLAKRMDRLGLPQPTPVIGSLESIPIAGNHF